MLSICVHMGKEPAFTAERLVSPEGKPRAVVCLDIRPTDKDSITLFLRRVEQAEQLAAAAMQARDILLAIERERMTTTVR